MKDRKMDLYRDGKERTKGWKKMYIGMNME